MHLLTYAGVPAGTIRSNMQAGSGFQISANLRLEESPNVILQIDRSLQFLKRNVHATLK